MPSEAQNATPTLLAGASHQKLREGSEGRVWNAGGYYRSDPIAMPPARGASRKVAVVGIVMLRGVAAYN